MYKVFIFLCCVLMSLAAIGQDKPATGVPDTTDLSNLSIDELAKLKSRYAATDMEKSISQAIEAASRKPLSLRKSPSIISVITDDEIERSGSKDLIDILKLIPGIEFNVDVEGVVAIAIRGMWANEGNVLLQIDGQEINENAFAGLMFGNHYPVDQIKKIETIRGPGSAIYGGYAEYAVINIILKKGDDIKGINAHLTGAQTSNTYSAQDIGIAIGNKTDKFTYAIAGFIGRGQRSDGNYKDIYGSTYNMTNNSNLNPHFFNLNLAWKDFSVICLYDNYITLTRDGYVNALSRPYPCDFLSYMSEIKYHKQLNKKIRFSTRFNFKHSVPWTFTGQPLPVDSSYSYYKILANRYRVNAMLNWEIKYWMSANFGIDGFYDHAYKPNGQLFVADNTNTVSYFNYAPYLQFLIKSHIANLTLGARYDVSTSFGSAFNPRLGITRQLGILNFKLLYASSFRAPSIEDIQFAINGEKLKPELSKTLEFETSTKITKDMFLSVNLFDITTYNAIRYFTTNTIANAYRNTNTTIGSQGAELEYNYKSSFGFIKFIYSFYTVGNKGVDSANAVSTNKNATLGTAQNKFTFLTSINIGQYCFISPSVNFLGKRYGYASLDSSGNGVLGLYQPQTQLNLYLGSHNLIKNTAFGVGVNNITNEQVLYLQAYNSLHGPLPGLGREFYIKFSYNFPFEMKKNAR